MATAGCPKCSGGNVVIVTCQAYLWIGLEEGFNDIKPTSQTFTFNLDSFKLRTGGTTRGKYNNAKAIAIRITVFITKHIKYIDLRHAYIVYLKG